MVPDPLDAATRRRMASQRCADTAPETALRKALHSRGYRYRVNFAPLPCLPRRRADIVFTRLRVAVYVDGCFWHGCPVHGSQPKHNAEWWRAKLARNVERDRDTDARLLSAGWAVVRVWEHEPLAAALAAVEAVLDSRGAQTRRVSR